MLLSKTQIGFGTMELCIEKDRPSFDEAQRIITDLVENDNLRFIDTADAYSLGEDDFGYGELLVAPLMNRDDVVIGTKGGFTRPGGAWKKRGDPKYIREACEKSLMRLGVDQIPLYQFHQPDPEVPFEETLGAFIELKNEGKVVELGLSNVSFEQLQLAQKLTKIRTVQNALSVLFYSPKEHDPMLRFCEENGITFLAYAPFGGHKNKGFLDQQQEIQDLATRADMTIYQFALNFLAAVSPAILPIPGSKTPDHIRQNLQAAGGVIPKDVMEDVMRMCGE